MEGLMDWLLWLYTLLSILLIARVQERSDRLCKQS